MAEIQQQIASAATDPTMRTASELAQQIRDGTLSSRDAVEAHIGRIEAVNPKLNAVIYPFFDQAREVAKAAKRIFHKRSILVCQFVSIRRIFCYIEANHSLPTNGGRGLSEKRVLGRMNAVM